MIRAALIVIVLLYSTARAAPDLDRTLRVIGMVEGDDPTSVGAAGERSRYKMLRVVWRRYTDAPFVQASSRDERLARTVARIHLAYLAEALQRRGTTPTVRLLALAWTAGLDGMRHASPAKLDYAVRAAALYSSVLYSVNKFTIYGDRVLVRELPEDDVVGGLYFPPSATRQYVAVEVTAVGDGRMHGMDGTTTRPMYVNAGDRVFIQVNPMLVANTLQRVDDVKYLAINQHDIIARITRGINDLTLEHFEPVGRWVLARVDVPDKVGEIFLPGSDSPLKSAGEIKTYLTKAGAGAWEALGSMPVGTRLLLDHMRINPLKLGRTTYVYTDIANIAGITDDPVRLVGPVTPQPGDVVARA